MNTEILRELELVKIRQLLPINGEYNWDYISPSQKAGLSILCVGGDGPAVVNILLRIAEMYATSDTTEQRAIQSAKGGNIRATGRLLENMDWHSVCMQALWAVNLWRSWEQTGTSGYLIQAAALTHSAVEKVSDWSIRYAVNHLRRLSDLETRYADREKQNREAYWASRTNEEIREAWAQGHFDHHTVREVRALAKVWGAIAGDAEGSWR